MKEKHNRENKHGGVEVMQISPPPSQQTAAATLRTQRRRVYLYSAAFFLLRPAEGVPAVPCRGRRAADSETTASTILALLGPRLAARRQDQTCRLGGETGQRPPAVRHLHPDPTILVVVLTHLLSALLLLPRPERLLQSDV